MSTARSGARGGQASYGCDFLRPPGGGTIYRCPPPVLVITIGLSGQNHADPPGRRRTCEVVPGPAQLHV
eukprot:4512143-Alexandrium_andersonii.AAC.3